MTTLAIYVAAAFAGGVVALIVRLPPMVGFLAAGFVLHGFGAAELPYLGTVADLGVTLLLFTIGLKLDVRTLVRREVWLTAATHMVVSIGVALGFFGVLVLLGASMLAAEPFGALVLLGFGLSFSSTVFVVKMLEDRSDSTTLYGRAAIGVLIMQDVAAVAFIAISRAEPPSPWALGLVLLLPLGWVLRRLWSHIGHGEMQALFGLLMALVPGYWLFDAVGIKGDLGALAMGALLASHPAASELHRALWGMKELFLVGFFISIGLIGLPSAEGIVLAALVLLLLPLKGVGYAVLLSLLRLRHRNAVLAGLSLTQFSEFGLIVMAVGAEEELVPREWLVVLALAVAMSFLLSAILNRNAFDLSSWAAARLPEQDAERLHPADRPIDVRGVDALVLGLGRVGRSAYERLARQGWKVLGVEHDEARVDDLTGEGYRVVRADATDRDFWERVSSAGDVRIAVLAMPFHRSNLEAYELLHQTHFRGRVAAVAQYDEDVAELERMGAQAVFHLYSSAGTALADSLKEVEDPG